MFLCPFFFSPPLTAFHIFSDINSLFLYYLCHAAHKHSGSSARHLLTLHTAVLDVLLDDTTSVLKHLVC